MSDNYGFFAWGHHEGVREANFEESRKGQGKEKDLVSSFDETRSAFSV